MENTTYQEFIQALDPELSDKDRQAGIDAWYDARGLMRGLYCPDTDEPSEGWSFEKLEAACAEKGLEYDASAGKMGMLWVLNPKDYPTPEWVTKAAAKQNKVKEDKAEAVTPPTPKDEPPKEEAKAVPAKAAKPKKTK